MCRLATRRRARRAALLQDRCRSCGCSRSVWRSDGLALEPPAGWVQPGLLTTCRPVGSSPWRGSKEARTPNRPWNKACPPRSSCILGRGWA